MKHKKISLLSLVFALLVVLVACGTKTWNVTFDAKNNTDNQVISVDNNKLVDALADPIRDGHDFSGWFKSLTDDEPFKFSEEVITADITLYAKWQLKTYTVSFNSDGGTLIQSQTIEHGSFTQQPENPTLDKHNFIGWFADVDDTTPFDFNLTAVKSNLDLLAKWTEKDVYTLSFDVNGGKETISTQNIVSGEKSLKPTNPTKANYVFIGWFDLSTDLLFDFEISFTNSIHLIAKWEQSDDLKNIYADLDLLNIVNDSVLTDHLSLPSRGQNGTLFSWVVVDNPYMTSTGNFINPVGEDVLVTLYVKAFNKSASINEQITLILPAYEERTIETKNTYNFENINAEYIIENSTLDLYFSEGGSVPFVNVQSFLNLLNGFIYADELEYLPHGNTLTITYDVTYYDEYDVDGNPIGTGTTETFSTTLDFDQNTITSVDLSFFSNYVKSTQTDYSAGISYLDSYSEDGNAVTFDLGNYRQDMIVYNDGGSDQFLIPLQIANQLFAGSSYFNVYFNSEKLYGIYGTGTADKDTIRPNANNGKAIPIDLAIATYDALAFSLDYFYGLRKTRNVTTYYTLLQTYLPSFLNGTTRGVSDAIYNFVYKTLDESHSNFGMYSYYEPASYSRSLSISDLGTRQYDFYNNATQGGIYVIQELLKARWGSNAILSGEINYAIVPPYRIIDSTTAVLILDGFVTASADDPDGFDTDRWMNETMLDLVTNYPDVTNIIVDLSYNMGGNLGALYRVMGYITEQPVEISYQFQLENQKYTYWVELEQQAYEHINWFFLTSKTTFSAGNLMAAIGKHMGIATIIGQRSGGGAASITPIYLPDGSSIVVSSNNVLSLRNGVEDNYKYVDIENGIVPDYLLSLADFYNDQALSNLVSTINQAKNTQNNNQNAFYTPTFEQPVSNNYIS